MSTHNQQLVSAAQLVGLAGAGCLTGLISSFSIFGVPAVMLAPTDLAAAQWKKLYVMGKASMPPFAVVCSSAFAYLAIQARGLPNRLPVSASALYASAALCLPMIVPYTLGPMHGNVRALESKADGLADAPSDAEVKPIIQRWSQQNVHRALIVATGAVLGGVAIFFA